MLIIIAYGVQIATKKYIPIIYWFAVTAVAIFGAMSSDFLIKNLNWTLFCLLLIPLGAWAYAEFYVRPGNEKVYQVVAVASFWVACMITRPLGASVVQTSTETVSVAAE